MDLTKLKNDTASVTNPSLLEQSFHLVIKLNASATLKLLCSKREGLVTDAASFFNLVHGEPPLLSLCVCIPCLAILRILLH